MDTIQQLQLFISRVEELNNTRLVKNKFSYDLTVSYDERQGSSLVTQHPDEDDLRSFLLTYRQFISDKEPVCLDRIFNLCHYRLTNKEYIDMLINARAIWNKSKTNIGIKLIVNGEELTPAYLTDLFINGLYFHSDEKKRKVLSMFREPSNSLIKLQFFGYLKSTTNVIFYTHDIVADVLKDGSLLRVTTDI